MPERNRRLVVLQNRPARAGAQTCLARLLRQPALRALNPALVCGEPGWLLDEARRHGIDSWVQPYPAVRSLAGRLYGNAAFARRLAARLAAAPPHIVLGNDYLEAPLTLALARRLGAHSALFLRASGLSRRDFEKYGCAQANMLIPIGDELANRLREWRYPGSILPSHDGLEASEFVPPGESANPPRRFLVLGTAHPDKGWGDLAQAIRLLSEQGRLPEAARFAFTGNLADAGLSENALLRGIGRQDGLAGCLNRYDCVIHPSRRESFGMAALEAVAAGVPVLSSRSGAIAPVIEDARWLFQPGDVADIARVLAEVLASGVANPEQRAAMQDRLRRRYPIEAQADALLRAWAPWLSDKSREAALSSKLPPH